MHNFVVKVGSGEPCSKSKLEKSGSYLKLSVKVALIGLLLLI
jgi:hypothetical protein